MINKIHRFIFRSVSILISVLYFRWLGLFNKIKIGKNIQIDGIIFVKMEKSATLTIGNNFKLNSRKASNLVGITNKASFQLLKNSVISIGDNCGFTSTVFSSRSSIKIGNNVKIGGNVRIFDHDYHSLNHINRRNGKLDNSDVKSFPVIIEDDVFIGTNSFILKGVHIGARSIIGAGSIVGIKNIPPDSLVAGNPASIIKTYAP